MPATLSLSDEEIATALASDDEELLRLVHLATTHPFYTFEPRPDHPDDFDEQSAFINDHDSSFAICLGGNGCIAAEQKVYVHGRGLTPITEIDRPFITLSWDGRATCLALANRPFVKGTAAIYRYSLSDGRSFLATAEHLVLTATGCWQSAKSAFEQQSFLTYATEQGCRESAFAETAASRCNQSPLPLRKGLSFLQRACGEASYHRAIQPAGTVGVQSSLCCRLASSAFRQQSTPELDLLSSSLSESRSIHKGQGFLADCPKGHRSRDGQLLFSSADGRSLIQRQADAREHSLLNCNWDDLVDARECNRTCPRCGRQSKSRSCYRSHRPAAYGSRVFCTPSKPASVNGAAFFRSPLLTCRLAHTTFASSRLATQSRSKFPRSISLGGNVGGTTHIVAMEFVRQGAFYDFTVHGTHCYVAEGVIHHNSGKTLAAAIKTARYVLGTPPPRELCPFWIIGDTYDSVCDVCWNEKLSTIIPASEILRYQWYQSGRNWPYAVILRHPVHRERPGWVLEFKSYEQGLKAMKAKSIGGYWFNEEVPYPIVSEVQARCRDYSSPGWADFTPVECKSPEWPDLYESPPDGWRFYHLNTRLNTALPDGWLDTFLAGVPEDMRELRTIGKFTALRGQVFKEFRKPIHVINEKKFHELTGYHNIPRDWRKVRGIDFGFNNPFACLWGARDHDGRWFIYREHYEPQRLIEYHAKKIHAEPWDASQPWYGPTYSDHAAQERAELGEHGIICTPANKTINQGIEYMRSLMMTQVDSKPKLFIFDNCVNLIREIQAYKWPEGTTARNPQDVPMDKDNHAVDACRYLLFSESVKFSDATPQPRMIRGEHRRHGVMLDRRGR